MSVKMLLSNLVSQKGELGTAEKIGGSTGGGQALIASGTVTVTENSMSISIPCPEGTRYLVWYPDERTAQEIADTEAKATFGGIATDLPQFDALVDGEVTVTQRSKLANGTVTANVMAAEEMANPFIFAVPSASTPAYILPGTYVWEAYGGSGGGSVTSVNGQTGAVVLTASDVGASPAETVVTVSGATPTIEPAANTIYKCGTLTSLTITDPPATGAYVIKFTSGSTATTTTIPASIIFPEAFAAEANTRYEINVEDGYAVAVGWPVS